MARKPRSCSIELQIDGCSLYNKIRQPRVLVAIPPDQDILVGAIDADRPDLAGTAGGPVWNKIPHFKFRFSPECIRGQLALTCRHTEVSKCMTLFPPQVTSERPLFSRKSSFAAAKDSEEFYEQRKLERLRKRKNSVHGVFLQNFKSLARLEAKPPSHTIIMARLPPPEEKLIIPSKRWTLHSSIANSAGRWWNLTTL